MIDLRRCREILGPGCQLTDEQLESLRDHLTVLANIALDVGVRELRDSAKSAFDMATDLMPDEQREQICERASIVEFDGGLTRTQAEEVALKMWAPELRNNGRIN